jgi:hypothetical protein
MEWNVVRCYGMEYNRTERHIILCHIKVWDGMECDEVD